MFVNFTNVLQTPAARSRRSASPRSASRSATRSRRATSSSAPASSSRWRWSSSCRPTRRQQWYEYWCEERLPLVRRPRHPRGPAAAAPPRRRRAVATTRRARPTWSSCSRGAGASSRASPTAPTTTSRQHAEHSGEELDYFDQATNNRYVPHVIEPAAGATRTMMAFLSRPTTRRRCGARRARCCASHPRLAPVQGGGAAAVEEGRR